MDIRLKQSRSFREKKNILCGMETIYHKQGKLPSISKVCPHILPISKNIVIGAPKINAAIGQVVFDPQKAQNEFLR